MENVEISPTALAARLAAGENVQLIDVREAIEYDYCHLPASILLPLSELTRRMAEVPAAGPVVLVCHHGVRSLQALAYLRQRRGLSNLLSLRGGIDAWSLTVDAAVPRY